MNSINSLLDFPFRSRVYINAYEALVVFTSTIQDKIDVKLIQIMKIKSPGRTSSIFKHTYQFSLQRKYVCSFE